MTRDVVLALDTAGTRALVALGRADGTMIAERRWAAGYRHGEELLAQLDGLLDEEGVTLEEIGGIVAGTGPGAFTGLRVGLATAKALAHGLGAPIAGVATSEALLAAAAAAGSGSGSGTAAAADFALLLPAGPSDRVAVHRGAATLVRGGEEPDLPAGTPIVAVDLAGRATADALARGEIAEAGLGAAMLRLGAARLAAGGDDLAELVPEYVTLPRGVPSLRGEVRWSHDRR
jgi:tRNA threonylcarbamoyl adenosine modification protein YeaZ